MQGKFTLLGGAALGALVACSLSAQAEAKTTKHHHHAVVAGDDRLSQLTSEVETLETRLEAQSLATEQLQTQVQAAQTQASEAEADAGAAHAQLQEQIQTIPGDVKSEIAAEKPKDGKIHYKGVALTIGGFAAAEGVYRSRNEEADIGSSFAKIPFANSPLAHTGETRGTARQSRLSLLAEGDINPSTHAAFYSEFDFLAGPQTANSNESNSFSPRIRNVYGTLDWDNWGLHLLAGQNWSLATMNSKGITPRNEVPPPTIDAQYVVGFSWARQPQIRLTKDFANKQVWAAVSVENPQSTFASAATGTTGTSVTGLTVTSTGTSTSQFDNTNSLSINQVPDVIGKLAFEPDLWGGRPLHLEVYGLYRNFADRVNVTSAANPLGLAVGAGNKSTNGGGVGWGVTYTAVPKVLDLMFSGLTGRGIGRYGSAQLPDSVVGPNGELKPINETMWMAGGTLHVTKALDVYGFYGDDRENNLYSHIGAGYYGFGSPSATLAGCSVEGGTCTADVKEMSQISAGLWDKVYTGSFGQIRVGLQYSYTKLTAFSGATGGSPKTDDNMIFTSFRYYPF